MKCKFTNRTRSEARSVHLYKVFKQVIPLLVGLLVSIQLVAQTGSHRVSGRVVDENNEPLPGATIKVKGTGNGTITDLEGRYTLDVSPESVLVVSFVGYLNEEIPVNNRSTIDVQLTSDIKSLTEVVVVGYGSMERQNVTGAISSIRGEELQKVPVPNVVEAMRGQVPGLRITRDSGQPGSGVSFTIRGSNSLTLSNEPLIVIDGVPNTGGNLAEINPDDIASIDILKDAAAASIYGSSGANGVILITTKRGTAGKPSVSVNASTGVTQLSMRPRMFNADEYVQLRRDAAAGAGAPNGINDVLTDPIELENYLAGREVNWHDELLRPGSINNLGVSVSGGTEKFKIYLNTDAYLEKGVVEHSSYNRYSMRLNTDYKPTNFIQIGANVQLTKSYADETGNTLDQDGRADFNDFVGNTPLGRTHDENGNLVPTVKGDQFQYNPLFRYQNSQVDRHRNRIYINPFLEVKLLEGLTYRLNTFAELRNERFSRFLSGPYNQSDRNFMRVQAAENTTYLLDNILNYSRSIADVHRIDATFVYGIQTNSSLTLNTIAEGSDDALGYHGIDNTPSERSRIGYGMGDWAREYYVGRLQYGFDERYILTLTMRRDGSSRFGPNMKYGTFPSISAAWNVDREDFMDNLDVFSQLKFRASYGLIGNDLISDNYPYLARAAQVQYANNRGLNAGFTTGDNAPNADLRWEESNQFNAGVDFGLINNRISGSVDYFITKTKDLLLTERLPVTSGYRRVYSNVGRTENWGIDANITGRIFTEEGFTWEAAANASMNRNRIISLNRSSTDAEGNPVHDYANNWFIDQQIGVIYGYIFDGIYQEGEEAVAAAMHPTYADYGPGDPKIRDISGPDGTPDGVITTDDQTFLGGSNPSWYGGLRNTFGYKGFELTVLFEIVQGVEKINYYYGSLTGRDNTIAVDYWTPENPSNVFPQPHQTQGYYFANAVRLRDASFVSLRNVALNYNLPAGLLNKTPLQSVSLYIRGNNLHYFTKYKDSYSPEVNAFNFPIQKVWTFGTRITL